MPDYPDILGYVTGGQRLSINNVDVAVATLPRIVKTGRGFDVLVLAQNTTLRHVEMTATVDLPTVKDTKGRKARLGLGHETMNFRLRPGEVGYLSIPCRCNQDTAGGTYKLAVAVTVQPPAKSTSLRSGAGVPVTDQTALTAEHSRSLEKLRQLEFSGLRRIGLRDAVETSFKVIGSLQASAETLPRAWTSLWNLAEDGTAHMLLSHYRTLLENEVLPRLNKENLFPALLTTTKIRFEAAGFPLKEQEAVFIAKLLTLVAHMANPGEDHYDYLGNQAFNISVLFKHALPQEFSLPRWFDGLIRAIAYNEQEALDPISVLCKQHYDALVRDTLPFAFAIIHKTTGEDMGTDEEIAQYSDNYLRLLRGGMDFGHAYLPLILGGIIVFDRVIGTNEVLDDTLRAMSDALSERNAEWTENNDLIFLLTRELVNRSLRLFGFQI